jgi:hypothetical protein
VASRKPPTDIAPKLIGPATLTTKLLETLPETVNKPPVVMVEFARSFKTKVRPLVSRIKLPLEFTLNVPVKSFDALFAVMTPLPLGSTVLVSVNPVPVTAPL